MLITNPFDLGHNEIRNLTPRKQDYIQQRNVAQEDRIDDIGTSILSYQKIIKVVRERYRSAKPEDQNQIKPYLTILYFELGQLLEEKGQSQEALRYYEQAGLHGHSISIENAKRLGSTKSFESKENVYAIKNKPNISEALHKKIVLIKSDNQKGSGVLAKDDTLGHVIVTVDHVETSGAIAYVAGKGIALDNLKEYEMGPSTFLKLADSLEIQDENIPLVLTNAQLKVGEKVYFGGYPFKKMDAYFHKGYVSSIGNDGKFSIDGVAVPGMSGGPIAIERDGKLYVVGTIASETFDPIEGFSKALDEMYAAESDKQIRFDWADEQRQSILEDIQSNPTFTKTPRGSLFIGNLEDLLVDDPDVFNKIWDDLHNQGIISDDDDIVSIPDQLGLRAEFQSYEYEIRCFLKARTQIKSIDSSQILLSGDWKTPTDSVNTIGLSLVQSLSTGIITGNLFQGSIGSMKSEFGQKNINSNDQESTELEIGRKNREQKNKKKVKAEGKKERTQAIKEGTFVNKGVPSALYRFVSEDDAKIIKQNGIVHLGGDLNEIPFLTQPNVGMARSVGAVTTDKMVTIYPDLIPDLTKANVRTVSERNNIVTYRINMTIPPDAIKITGS